MKKIYIILAVVLVAVGGYGTYAYMSKQWPFTEKAADVSTTSEPGAIEITKATADENSVSILVKKNLKEDGYCVLEFSSKQALLKIDDSKNKEDPDFVACQGWTLGRGSLPKGTYTAKVILHVGDKTYDTSKQVEL
jgi:hypothetical protein